jgi:YhcH/YjgK/YiaL family protein
VIVDHQENYHLYSTISPLLAQAFGYILSTDLQALAAGHYAIDGKDLYVIVSEYATKPSVQGTWEAHRRYIDLQYMIRGTERIGYSPISRMKPGAYDADKDCMFLEGSGDFLTLRKGDFMVLRPDDAHMPGIAVEGPSPVKKAVFKILV